MIEEKVIVAEGTKYPLNGLLTLPSEIGAPIPAVVFVHGSGSSNMDEKVGKLTPFKDLAQGLARHGIASLRYDKRSFAHGMKMVRDKSHVITVKEETIEDALLATEMLKSDSRIDPSRVFIIGHSMGGMLAPRIDAEGGNYRGLVMLAGTPRTLEEVMRSQTDEALGEMNALLRLVLGGQMKRILKAFDGMYDVSDEDAKKKKLGNGTTLYYFKEMGQHAAPDYLLASDKPMLIMQGSKDVQVKVDKDFGAYQELLKGKPNVTFKLYEGLNHAFVPALFSGVMQANKEFGVERHIGEDVIADIANWVKSA